MTPPEAKPQESTQEKEGQATSPEQPQKVRNYDNAMTYEQREAIVQEFGKELIADVFFAYIVERKRVEEVMTQFGIIDPNDFDEIIRVNFYLIDKAGSDVSEAMELQKDTFNAMFSLLGKGTQKRITQALKRVKQQVDAA